MNCGEAVVATLAAHDVRVLFGIPGTHNLALYAPLAASGILHVTPRHEQGAGYAADGYARVSGRPGVVVTTTGPGLTNVMTAAATAYHDSVPLLVISPGMATGVEGRDAGHLHQAKAQSAAMDSLVAWSRRVMSGAEAVAAIAEAFASFAHGRARPVHVEIPLDVLESDAAVEPAAPLPVPAPDFDERGVEAAAALLRTARRPALLLGGGAIGAAGPAVALAERLGAPVVTTVRGKGIVPEDHPLSLGASLRLESARRLLAEADVVLAAGTELAESDLWVERLAFEGALVRVDVEPGQLHKNAAADVAVLGDAALALARLVETLAPGEADGGAARAAAAREAIAAQAAADGAPYAALSRALREVLADDAILVGDNAQVVYRGAIHQFPVADPRRFVYQVGFSTLGYALPAAVGAQLARPGAQVAALVGDGGAMFSIAELATAVELGLPLVIVVAENGGYGEIREGMRQRGMQPLAVDLHAPDFVALARAFGARGERLDPTDPAPQLAAALSASGPTVLALAVG